jgi:RimJ/RimL family protein N-acetyltransferase
VTGEEEKIAQAPLSQSPRVLALEWNLPFHVDVATYLAERHSWKFVYWVGDEGAIGARVRERFPEIIFHETVDARYGRPPMALAALEPQPFDERMARILAYEHNLVLKMMDRFDLEESFGFAERTRLFHRLVAWWEAALDFIKPEIMMIPTAPHVVYDYIVYALCRRRGIRTVMFENAGLPGMLLRAPAFEQGFPELITKYCDFLELQSAANTTTLSKCAEEYIAKARGSYSKPEEMVRIEKIHSALGHWDISWSRLRILLKKIRHAARYPLYMTYLFDGLRRSLLKLCFGIPGSASRRISGFYHERLLVVGEASLVQEARHSKWVIERSRRLRRDYDSRCTPVDLSTNFVYVPLHVQPERSTSPNGGIYDHTQLMIDALAQSMPTGWLLYVKEHPAQFAPWQLGERGRRLSDYQRITCAPTVRLVPRHINPFDLIDKARAVATITGTSGWEALARGVPVLCFGIAWYQGCDGVFDVRLVEDLRSALQRIASGFKPSLERVRLFLKAVEEVSIRGFIDEEARELSKLTEAENVIAIAHGLISMANSSPCCQGAPSLRLRRAAVDDAAMLHAWRNDPETRRNSRQDHLVPWETHKAWLAAALACENRDIRIAEEEGRPVGVVRADHCDGGWELSWIVAPEARGRGIGQCMLRQFTLVLEGRLTAIIRADNTASIKVAAAAGLMRVGPADRIGFEVWGKGNCK